MSSLHNDLRTWVAKARTHGLQTIYLNLATADKIVDCIVNQATEIEKLREALREIIRKDDTGPMAYELRESGPSIALGGTEGIFAGIARNAIARASPEERKGSHRGHARSEPRYDASYL